MEGEEREGSCGLQEVSPQCLVSHSRRGCSWRTEAMGPWLGHLLSGFQDPGQARPAVSPGGAPRPEHLPFQAVIPDGILLTDKIDHLRPQPSGLEDVEERVTGGYGPCVRQSGRKS